MAFKQNSICPTLFPDFFMKLEIVLNNKLSSFCFFGLYLDILFNINGNILLMNLIVDKLYSSNFIQIIFNNL